MPRIVGKSPPLRARRAGEQDLGDRLPPTARPVHPTCDDTSELPGRVVHCTNRPVPPHRPCLDGDHRVAIAVAVAGLETPGGVDEAGDAPLVGCRDCRAGRDNQGSQRSEPLVRIERRCPAGPPRHGEPADGGRVKYPHYPLEIEADLGLGRLVDRTEPADRRPVQRPPHRPDHGAPPSAERLDVEPVDR
jgi:hypothetical protein